MNIKLWTVFFYFLYSVYLNHPPGQEKQQSNSNRSRERDFIQKIFTENQQKCSNMITIQHFALKGPIRYQDNMESERLKNGWFFLCWLDDLDVRPRFKFWRQLALEKLRETAVHSVGEFQPR